MRTKRSRGSTEDVVISGLAFDLLQPVQPQSVSNTIVPYFVVNEFVIIVLASHDATQQVDSVSNCAGPKDFAKK